MALSSTQQLQEYTTTSGPNTAIENWLSHIQENPHSWKYWMLDVYAYSFHSDHYQKNNFDSGFFYVVAAFTTEEERTVALVKAKMGLRDG
jgi:hypothetical protein